MSFRALRCHPERSEEPVLNEVKESRSEVLRVNSARNLALNRVA
jgi:hypothetical protein